MKFTKIAALAGLLALSGAASASFVDVNAFGGYTTLKMDDANSKLSGGTKVDHGYYVGADAAFSFFPIIKIGPRVEYLAANQGKTGTATVDLTLTLAELGISTDWSLPLTGLSISAGLWGGYGIVGGTSSMGNVTGNTFTGEAMARVKYSIIPLLSFGIEGGYRMAKCTNTEFGGNTDNQPALDFGGINAGAGLNLNF